MSHRRTLAILAVVVMPAMAIGAEPLPGAAVYAARCAACHGDTGAGDGPAAAALEPRPRNFRDPGFWTDRTPEQIKAVVRDGKPGTMMSPFKDVLSAPEIDAVVDYVRGFRPDAAAARP